MTFAEWIASDMGELAGLLLREFLNERDLADLIVLPETYEWIYETYMSIGKGHQDNTLLEIICWGLALKIRWSLHPEEMPEDLQGPNP
jgi:hypothetical protein